MLTLQTPPILSWPPISQTPHVFSSWQFPAFSLPPLQNSPNLEYYSLVPLQQQSAIKTSPQMRIYDESNHNQYIEKSDDAIMKGFTKFLEENPDKISKLSNSNIIISYKILNGNNLSLSFDFIDSGKENQNHNLTFINGKDTKLVATKSKSILKMEETAKRETEEKAKKEAEEKARKEAEEKAKKEAEEKARKEAEEKTKKEAEEKAKKEAEEKAKKEAEERAEKEAEEKAKKEAEEKAKKEAEEKARKEAEEKAKKEAEEKAKKEAEERAEKEAEETAKREAEDKAKKEAEERAKLEAEEKAEKEKLAIALAERALNDAVDEIAEEKKMSMMEEIESEITEIANMAYKSISPLLKHELVDSIDMIYHSESKTVSELDMFCSLRSPKKENFYEILTEDGEAKAGLIDYLAQYDDSKKSEKLESLVKLIVEKNKSYEKPQSPSVDKAMIMEDLMIELGVRIFENYKEVLSAQATNARSFKDYNESDDQEKENVAKEIQDKLRNLLKKTYTKLTEFLEKTGYNEEKLENLVAERLSKSNPQSNPAHAEILSTQANARS